MTGAALAGHAMDVAEDVIDSRRRLLDGIAQSVADKGYADTTITDIVREAAVSRRTFYEHFDNKAQCLIALYEAASLAGLAVLQRAVDRRQPWQQQTEQALRAYLTWMAQRPVLLRTLFIEILGLGAEGLHARREIHDQIARFIAGAVNAASPRAQALSIELARAIVGGIHELMLEYIELGKETELVALVPVVRDLVLRVADRPVA